MARNKNTQRASYLVVNKINLDFESDIPEWKVLVQWPIQNRCFEISI